MKPRSHVAFLVCLAAYPAVSQTLSAAPLPDIPTLMRQVEAHQRLAEAVQKDYLYHSKVVFDKLDSKGGTRKSSSMEREIFWLNGVEVSRDLTRDGKDLSADDLKKENERIDKQVAKARERRDKADAQGKETDSHGHEEVTVSRMLELGTFTNARRQRINGRDTILVDFTGDPKAKTHDVAESAIHDMAGTVWVDEQDKDVQRIEGRFINNFKIGAGVVASIEKGTWFKATNIRINDEVWLPATFEAHGHARYLLFFSLDGNVAAQTSGYRKFKASSTILPTFTAVDPGPNASPSSPFSTPEKPAAPVSSPKP